MNGPTPAHVLRFGIFELDTNSGELRRHGLKIRLPDQSFQILKELLNRSGDVVTRDELRRVLWTSETFVDFEVGLNSAVRKLRESLGDSAENPRFVETLPRRGYRFIASVSVPAMQVAPELVPPSPAAEPPPLAFGPERVVAPPAEAVVQSVEELAPHRLARDRAHRSLCRGPGRRGSGAVSTWGISITAESGWRRTDPCPPRDPVREPHG